MTDRDPDALLITVAELELQIAPPLTNRELHLVKQIAGIRAGEIAEALNAADTDLHVALAHIGLRRAGRTHPTVEQLWELGAGEIKVSVPPDMDEDDDAEPDPTRAGDDAGEPGSPVMIPGSPGGPNTPPS